MMVDRLLDGELEKWTWEGKYQEVKWLAILVTEELAWQSSVVILLFSLVSL